MVGLANAVKGLVEAISSAEKAAGIKKPTTVNIAQLLADFGIPTVVANVSIEQVAEVKLDLAPTDVAKVVRVDEARASQGLPPIGDDRGQMTLAELDALSKVPPAAAEGAPTKETVAPETAAAE